MCVDKQQQQRKRVLKLKLGYPLKKVMNCASNSHSLCCIPSTVKRVRVFGPSLPFPEGGDGREGKGGEWKGRDYFQNSSS